MKEKLLKYSKLSKSLLFPLLLVLLFVILLKQMNLYHRLISLYKGFYPLFSGIIIAFLFQPIIDKLHTRLKLKLSVVIVYVGILSLFMIFIAILLPILYEQLINISRQLPNWLKMIDYYLKQVQISFFKSKDIEKYVMKDGYQVVFHSLVSWFSSFTQFIFGYICAFFISLDLEFWIHTGKKMIPNFHQFSLFYKTMSSIIYQYLFGTLLDMLFIVFTISPILYLSHFPNALFYGLLLALLNLWPYIGATIGLLLILFISIFTFDTLPFFPLLLIWLIQQIESNVIQPFIFNKTMSVRPILSFAFLFISESIFGIVGVILSPIFAAIAQIVFRSYLHSKTSNEIGKWEDIWYDFDDIMADHQVRDDCI
ncbi:MAG: AI-2E family transporter [Erysipelotrichaceae bacterium]